MSLNALFLFEQKSKTPSNSNYSDKLYDKESHLEGWNLLVFVLLNLCYEKIINQISNG